MLSDFPAFGKIPRLHKPVIVTEKIDGTNGLISIEHMPDEPTSYGTPVATREGAFIVRAGSRNRWLTLDADNHGFARWVTDHAEQLVRGLGAGRHYGEWWGSGINRGYGLTNGKKRFSLFNVSRWGDYDVRPECCEIVPVLMMGDGSQLNDLVEEALLDLVTYGSQAAVGYGDPEGVVVYHSAANVLFKVTLDGDKKPAVPKMATVPYVGRHVSDVPPWTWPATRMAPFSGDLAKVG